MDKAIEMTLNEPKAVLFDSEILVYYKMMKYDCNEQVDLGTLFHLCFE